MLRARGGLWVRPGELVAVSDMDRELARIAEVTAPVFFARGWDWGSDQHTPSAPEIASVLRGLLAQIDQEPYDRTISTGRFHIEIGPDEDDPAVITWSVMLTVGSGTFRRLEQING